MPNPDRAYTPSLLRIALWTLLATLLCILPSLASVRAAEVLIIPIHGEIDSGTAAHVRRAVHLAETQQGVVLLDLDTFGGEVAPATQIRDTLLRTSAPTIAYVHPRAWSAGALIALAAREVVMAPDGSIGAAEPIPATEKTIAALRGEFAATAQARGRNAELAAAMVDKTRGAPPYATPGTILSLTAADAVSAGMATRTAQDIDDLLAASPWSASSRHTVAPEWTDRLTGWLSSPIWQIALIGILFAALLAEIKTAGFSGGGLVAAVAAALLLAGPWQAGTVGWIEPVLIGGGILLLLGDLLVFFSGWGAGTGLLLIMAGVYLLLGGGTGALYLTLGGLILAVVLFALMARYLSAGRLWHRLALTARSTSADGYVSNADYSAYLHARGVAITPLRPAGTVRIGDTRLDVVTCGEFIAAGTPVRVITVSGSRIVVAAIV